MKTERRVFRGTPVSPGMARAKACVYCPLALTVTEGCFAAGEEARYLTAFHDAVVRAEKELCDLKERLGSEDASKAKIFAAHREILEDEELQEEITRLITEERRYPDDAISQVLEEFAALLADVEDPLIRGRVADLQDVKQRLLRIYQGKEEKNLADLTEDVIVVAHDLLPSDTATMNRKHVKGIVTEMGGTNSHSAILARSFQIPAVLGVTGAMSEIPDGAVLAMDALTGELLLAPTDEELAENEKKEQDYRGKKQLEEQYRDRPAILKDGTPIQIGINVGSAEFDVPETQFDFVGLFRTEFLYMEAAALPSEEVQLEAYKKALRNAKGHPVTLRTLDIGGDKTLLYLPLPKEENPFLGRRALRLCLEEEKLFQTQLRAALRASAFGPLRLMFPMVGSMEDIYRAKACVEQAKRSLAAEKISYDENIKLGIMIEIPSIALVADLAAEEVDFASIGSNDLTQYVSAADRMNASVGSYYQNYSPAMFRLLGYVLETFARQGKPVSVCGEMAGDPEAAVALAGLGARKLSMSAANVAGVKAALAQVSMEEAREMAQSCKQLKTEGEILAALNRNGRRV